MFEKEPWRDPVSPFRRSKFPFEDVNAEEPSHRESRSAIDDTALESIPAEDLTDEQYQRKRILKLDPQDVRRRAWEGEEVYPDEIVRWVYADEIAATTIQSAPAEESDLGDL
jgi:hypothetical protein